MKINPQPSGSNNDFFHPKTSSVFNPIPPTFFNFPKNYSFTNDFPNSFKCFNTYQNLYKRIILQDITAINNFKKQKQKK